ncbi:MAG: cell division protein DivIC (FtsB), stabilizes FtsL against RasP cleavage [Segetibacter sp.]|jgi:cell division protein FtsB|nr:cell division protein DivIC (FtsB), stabilizes FtsL against RasP cleavage [Segetibacter sp.]
MIKLSALLRVFRNKYLVSIIIFVVWVSFFDRNDLITQWDRKQELKKLEISTSFYENEIAKTKKDLTELNNNPAVMEKFAREKFYLKRPNEEIFVVDDSTEEKKSAFLQ